MIDLYLPSLPHMTDEFGATAKTMQMSLPIYLLSFGITPLVLGPLADRYSRYRVLAWGLVGYGLVSGMTSLVTSASSFLVLRGIQGATVAAIMVAQSATLYSSFSGAKLLRVTAYNSVTWSLVPILAPLFGGLIQDYLGWRYNFWALTVFAAATLILASRWFPRDFTPTKHSLGPSATWRRYRQIIANRSFLGYTLITALVFASQIAFNTASPFIIQSLLGYSATGFGAITLVVSAFYLAGATVTSTLARGVATKTMLRRASIVYALSGLSMVVVNAITPVSLFGVCLPVCIMMAAAGFIYPAAAALAFSDITEHHGQASALYGLIQIVCCSLASTIIAALPENSALPLSGLMALITCCLIGLAWRLTDFQTPKGQA